MIDLFKGISIIIDDEINSIDQELKLKSIVEQIKNEKIPLLKYTELPSDKEIENFQSISFLILDWNLQKNDNELGADGIILPETIQDDVIEFISKVNSICFCPIFIFTNEEVEDVIDLLTDKNLYFSDKPNNIFVKSKSEVSSEPILFKTIEEWLSTTPSIYVLKKWETEYQKTKNDFFTEFQNLSGNWPYIVWKAFEEDGVNQSEELRELLARNLMTRFRKFEFDNNILENSNGYETAEIKKVLEGERYISNYYLDENHASTGDIFKCRDKNSGKIVYFLNIRPECDTARGKNPHLYCLRGEKIQEENVIHIDTKKDDQILLQEKQNKILSRQFDNDKENFYELIDGQFIEKINTVIVPFIDDGSIIKFKLRELKLMKWKALKDHRIGRLLPPHITRIQQKYSFYSQRKGLPRIPKYSLSQ